MGRARRLTRIPQLRSVAQNDFEISQSDAFVSPGFHLALEGSSV
jgi:hypothetical protein